MKRCPECRSRKWKEFETGKWRCLNCGKEWWNPSTHAPTDAKEQRWGGVNGNAIALIDYHNIVYKFFIRKDNPCVHLPFKNKMRGWTQEWDIIDGVKFQRTPLSVIIFLNRRLLRKQPKHEIETEGLNLIKGHALLFQTKYNIVLDIDHPEPVRKEVKLLEGFKSAEQFEGNICKVVYRTGEPEFTDKVKAISHTQNFIEGLAVENKSDVLIAKMDGGFNTIAYLMSQQNEIVKKFLEKNSHVPTPKGVSDKNILLGLLSSKLDRAKQLLIELNKIFDVRESIKL